ncbi:uncharacterized protein LOC144630083 isoform X2 [Oculina patagonica]
MTALEFRFAIFFTTVVFVFGLINVKGDIAPDVDFLSNSNGTSMYDEPTEYQRTKRSYIEDDDTGLTNDDDDDNDDDIGDEGFYDGDEDDDDNGDSLGKGLKASDSSSSVFHKKDEIRKANAKHVEKQQPLSMEDDDKSLDEAGSSDDSEGSISGSGSDEVRSQNSYARQHVSDKEEHESEDSSAGNDDIDGSSDMDNEETKHIEQENASVSARRTKPRNLIKMVLEESKDAEQEEKLEQENDVGNSGQEAGSSAGFVQGSGETGAYHEEEQPAPKPHPKTVPQVSNSSTTKDVAKENETLHNQTHVIPKPLEANDRAGELNDHPKSDSSKIKAKVEIKDKDLKSKLHKEKAQSEENSETSKAKIEHNAELHKKSAKKEPIRVSKVSHLAKKRLHNKYVTAHVTHPHVVESHSKVVHKKPISKASQPMCHSDKILGGHSLKGGTRAGHFETLGETASMHACLQRCCSKHTCDVALLIDGRCYGVACYSKELCEAIPVPHPHFVFSQLGFVTKGQKRGDIEKNQEFHCQYGNLTLRNNEQWSGELCGGVVRCKDGITTVKKCPGIPPKPDDCAKPRLIVKHRSGECCQMKWNCKARHCVFNNRLIKHGYKLSDPLCTGVVSCYNGHLNMEYCPKIPDKPTDCARPKLKTINVPGKCCKKLWVCSDKSCKYDGLKLSHGEKLTDASCAVVMECRNGFLHNKQCPGPPPVPHTCINPLLKVKRVPGECCEMNWTCEMS